MLRPLKACVSAFALLTASPAIADLVIDIPDVPEFTLSDPIISTEDVVINAQGGTDLIIAASISAPSITISNPASLTVTDNAVLEGDIVIEAGGTISIPQSDGDPGVITVSGGTGADTPIVILPPAESGSLGSSALPPLETDLGGGSQASGLFRANAFTSKLFSCPQSSADKRFDEGTCAYAIGGIDRLEGDSGAGDFDDTTFAFTLGAQTELTDNVFLGGALGYESSHTDSATIASETDRGRAGIVLKYDDGSFSAGLALAAAYGAIDTTRALTGATVEGATHAISYDARLRAAYGLAFGELAVEPALAVSVLHQRQDAYAETGSALAARRIDGINTTTLGVHPSLTLGTDFVAGPFDTRIRPELILGLDWFSDPDVTLTGTGATGRPLFQTISPDQLTGTVAAGLTVFAADDVSLRFRYQGRFGEDTIGHGGQVKLSLGF